jgi:hypothetical protein
MYKILNKYWSNSYHIPISYSNLINLLVVNYRPVSKITIVIL